MWLLFIGLMVFVDVIYISIAKYWSLHTEKWYLPLVGFIFLIGTNIFFLVALKEGSGLARGTTYFGILSAMVSIVIAYVFFKETFTLIQMAGFILGVISLILLQ